jgi:predicted DNA-binding helix-hairpin-helix protein
MIVGADAASDADIVGRASTLYGNSACAASTIPRSARSPMPAAVLPLKRPPLMREHRLYQSDWLMRFYGYAPHEVQQPAGRRRYAAAGYRSQAGLGAASSRETFRSTSTARRVSGCCAFRGWAPAQSTPSLPARRQRRLRLEDVGKLTVSVAKVRPFIVAEDWRPVLLTDRADLRSLIAPQKGASSLNCSRHDPLSHHALSRGFPCFAGCS